MVELYKPQIEDLWFREKILGDELTMSFNHSYGGIINFPTERWESWYDSWIVNPENKRFYRYIKNKDTFIGEVAYHFDDERHLYIADVLVYAPYRGKGYGTAALLLLCDVANKNGIKELFDDIAIDNQSVSLFLKCGFMEVKRTDVSVLVKKELGDLL